MSIRLIQLIYYGSPPIWEYHHFVWIIYLRINQIRLRLCSWNTRFVLNFVNNPLSIDNVLCTVFPFEGETLNILHRQGRHLDKTISIKFSWNWAILRHVGKNCSWMILFFASLQNIKIHGASWKYIEKWNIFACNAVYVINLRYLHLKSLYLK